MPREAFLDKVWQRSVVADLGVLPQPAFVPVTGSRVEGRGTPDDIRGVLRARPGRYILKPRVGSNGVGVVRVVSRPDGVLTVETDCPDTALFLDEFPADPDQRGGDVVVAVATRRGRYVDRARAGLPDWALEQSILEDEIRRDEAGGCVFEPRVVIQRTGGDSFVTLGAICKVVATPVGACVARGFREESLATSLHKFLAPRVSPGDLADGIRRAHSEVLATGERIGTAFAALVTASGVRVHQFGIDCRLCWDAAARRVEFPFLEVQFGIGRIDPDEVGADTLPGYRTPDELRARFGPEV
jgi:hypothetical protein